MPSSKTICNVVLRWSVLWTPDYEMSKAVWERAIRLADGARAVGVTVPLADLLIFSCAAIHELELAHDDRYFDELATIGA